ncbi:Ltp family lipoprotein [Nocardioides sp.]|uniref:Ltp family lipoprotein n=1 Tax=Nocardioides sp. TaxID=35761 RepID=UPI002B66EF4D|nr:Ltp family lipoprotein [Nocardioides sp.]HXH77333.1 Ltp family lipoprotein [Nocardioides sp.]
MKITQTAGAAVACTILMTLGSACAPVETDDKTAAERATEKREKKDDGSTKDSSSPKAKPTKEAPAMTGGQENALAKAEEYLSFSAFSQSGLVEQLMFEDFSKADATFAVNQLKVNWNEQAAAKAEEYMSVSSFSRQSLIDQLKFEGFTEPQAVYGVNNGTNL